MNSQTPRAGDKAMVIWARITPQIVGLIVEVLSDPFKHRQGAVVSEIRFPTGGAPDASGSVLIHTSKLLRLPPDDEAKRLFGEREVVA